MPKALDVVLANNHKLKPSTSMGQHVSQVITAHLHLIWP